ncbi:MAG: AcrR family transcriptional regulator [Ilumatobacter sp.]|jgi:AcrR family transcriptional regulator
MMPIDTPDQTDPRVERTRTAVLDAGVSILFEEGPDSVTHAAVASASRVSRTTLYKYWPTRGDLLLEILTQVEPHKTVELTGDVRTDIAKRAHETGDAFRNRELNKVFGSLLAQAQWDDETTKARDALVAAAMADMSVVLDHAVQNGQLPAGLDPVRAAGRLIGPVFFAALVVQRPLEVPEVDALVDDWLAYLRT